MKDNFTRVIRTCPVSSVSQVSENTFVMSFLLPEVARSAQPGQFVNIRVSDSYVPLFRRPFSVYRTAGDFVEIVFNAIGSGTRILSRMKEGDRIDVLGPLGRTYGLTEAFDTAVLVAGGLGVAPMPILTDHLTRLGRRIVTFLGARTGSHLVPGHLANLATATDDGSEGFKGSVVDLLERSLQGEVYARPKIFSCGPNRMLENVAALAASRAIPCEVSLECTMACGIGICQGCPVERTGPPEEAADRRRYSLVCKEGPVFDSRTIVME